MSSLVLPLEVEKRAGATSKFSPLLLNCHMKDTTPGSAATWHRILIVSSKEAPIIVISDSLLQTGASEIEKMLHER